MIEFNLTMKNDMAAGLDRLATKVREQVLLSGAATMAKVIYDEVQLNASRHVKSGALYNAIYRVYAKDKSTDNHITYEISWNKATAPHGHLIEFGSSKSPAYPFIRPAFDHMPEAIHTGQQRMKVVMKNTIKAATKRNL